MKSKKVAPMFLRKWHRYEEMFRYLKENPMNQVKFLFGISAIYSLVASLFFGTMVNKKLHLLFLENRVATSICLYAILFFLISVVLFTIVDCVALILWAGAMFRGNRKKWLDTLAAVNSSLVWTVPICLLFGVLYSNFLIRSYFPFNRTVGAAITVLGVLSMIGFSIYGFIVLIKSLALVHTDRPALSKQKK
jgi:hypothetical protein